ncbi:hypothetical protein [Ramlibacter sp.]|uniref:hypothetical protein n=1 Tax=Ramlibacter sp. TaxID=1917967 RepID=UPI00262202E0|nr:hypothetical protein [Ramlibacter sp.]
MTRVAQPETSGKSMSKAKDELRREYRRDDLGKGVRGKYLSRVSKGTNLVLLDDEIAKAFPTTEAVNEALTGLLELTEQTARITGRSTRTIRKRAAG